MVPLSIACFSLLAALLPWAIRWKSKSVVAPVSSGPMSGTSGTRLPSTYVWLGSLPDLTPTWWSYNALDAVIGLTLFRTSSGQGFVSSLT